MDSFQDASAAAETPATTTLDIDVWAWAQKPHADLDLNEILGLRHQVMSRPEARQRLLNELEKASAESGETPSQTGIGNWMAGNYRVTVDALKSGEVSSSVADYARAESMLFAGQMGLDGVVSNADGAADILLKNNTRSDDENTLLLTALTQARRFDEVAKVLENASESYRESPDGYYFRGTLAESEGEYDQSESLYSMALEIDPDHNLSLFKMARWYDYSTEDEKAFEYYEFLAKQEPPQINVLLNLGLLYEDHNRFRDAAYCYRRILAVCPNHPRARLFLNDAEASLTMYYDEDQEVRQDRKNQILKIPVSDFELSVRSRNCLAKMNIVTLGDLVAKTEAELLSYKNFGETSLNEIKQILDSKGIRLGMRPEDDLEPVVPASQKSSTPATAAAPAPSFQIDPNDERLQKSVNELPLSVRARKCLSNLEIVTLGQLVSYTTDDLLSQRNFGATSLREIAEQLEIIGLSLRTVDR